MMHNFDLKISTSQLTDDKFAKKLFYDLLGIICVKTKCVFTKMSIIVPSVERFSYKTPKLFRIESVLILVNFIQMRRKKRNYSKNKILLKAFLQSGIK